MFDSMRRRPHADVESPDERRRRGSLASVLIPAPSCVFICDRQRAIACRRNKLPAFATGCSRSPSASQRAALLPVIIAGFEWMTLCGDSAGENSPSTSSSRTFAFYLDDSPTILWMPLSRAGDALALARKI